MATHALNLRHKSEPPISRTSLSLSISSTFCRQRRAVRALTVLISGIRLAPTGQM